MRKIILYIAILVATSLMADEIHWAKDFQSGIETAQKENKPVLFIISKHSCPPCKLLAATTYKDERVIKMLNENFVSIIAHTDERDAMPRSLFLGVTPTIWFLKPSSEPMFEAIKGAPSTHNFLYYLGVVKTDFDNNNKRVQ